jgi:hypothetical protein
MPDLHAPKERFVAFNAPCLHRYFLPQSHVNNHQKCDKESNRIRLPGSRAIGDRSFSPRREIRASAAVSRRSKRRRPALSPARIGLAMISVQQKAAPTHAKVAMSRLLSTFQTSACCQKMRTRGAPISRVTAAPLIAPTGSPVLAMPATRAAASHGRGTFGQAGVISCCGLSTPLLTLIEHRCQQAFLGEYRE